jgi:hypothetical protein
MVRRVYVMIGICIALAGASCGRVTGGDSRASAREVFDHAVAVAREAPSYRVRVVADTSKDLEVIRGTYVIDIQRPDRARIVHLEDGKEGSRHITIGRDAYASDDGGRTWVDSPIEPTPVPPGVFLEALISGRCAVEGELPDLQVTVNMSGGSCDTAGDGTSKGDMVKLTVTIEDGNIKAVRGRIDYDSGWISTVAQHDFTPDFEPIEAPETVESVE